MNKPRLIDANDVKDLIRGIDSEFAKFVDEIPTAYDVQGVVEQLENLKQHENENHAYATVWGIQQSIEIVKGGAE